MLNSETKAFDKNFQDVYGSGEVIEPIDAESGNQDGKHGVCVKVNDRKRLIGCLQSKEAADILNDFIDEEIGFQMAMGTKNEEEVIEKICFRVEPHFKIIKDYEKRIENLEGCKKVYEGMTDDLRQKLKNVTAANKELRSEKPADRELEVYKSRAESAEAEVERWKNGFLSMEAREKARLRRKEAKKLEKEADEYHRKSMA